MRIQCRVWLIRFPQCWVPQVLPWSWLWEGGMNPVTGRYEWSDLSSVQKPGSLGIGVSNTFGEYHNLWTGNPYNKPVSKPKNPVIRRELDKELGLSIFSPVVPHKAVAEVSKIGHLYERLVVVNHGWQSEFTDGPKGGWSCGLWIGCNGCSGHITTTAGCSVV